MIGKFGLLELIVVLFLGLFPLLIVGGVVYLLVTIKQTVERTGRTLDDIAVALRSRNAE